MTTVKLGSLWFEDEEDHTYYIVEANTPVEVNLQPLMDWWAEQSQAYQACYPWLGIKFNFEASDDDYYSVINNYYLTNENGELLLMFNLPEVTSV